MGESSREMLEKLNDIVWSINPENDTLEKLEIRIRNYANIVGSTTGIQMNWKFEVSDGEHIIPMKLRRCVYLIFKEAMHNIIKYAGCRNVFFSLQLKGKLLAMEIEDDGKGFDPSNLQAYNGNGIRNMRERVKESGGRIVLESEPGKGTRIHVSLPLKS